MKNWKATAASVVSTVFILCGVAHANVIRIGYIDPLSGPMANVGSVNLKDLTFVTDQINARGGVLGSTYELVPLDSKMNPEDASIALKKLTDMNVHFVLQGVSSSVAGALLSAVDKHNAREPDNRILYLNYASVNDSLTNEKCSFWFFRFNANSDMQIRAEGAAIVADKSIKKLFMIAQDFPTAHAGTDKLLALVREKRPDIKIVGTEYHPMGKVKDFSPYVERIRQSGADTVVAAAFGNDLTLLIRAAREAGLNVKFHTYYANGLGVPEAIGEAGVDRVKVVTEWHNNAVQSPAMGKFYSAFKARYPDPHDEFISLPIKNAMEMLTLAIAKAKSTDPRKVALALEGLSYASEVGTVTMRAKDHQLLQPLFISTLERKGSPGTAHDVDGSGFGFRVDRRMDASSVTPPTSCKMSRPAD